MANVDNMHTLKKMIVIIKLNETSTAIDDYANGKTATRCNIDMAINYYLQILEIIIKVVFVEAKQLIFNNQHHLTIRNSPIPLNTNTVI